MIVRTVSFLLSLRVPLVLLRPMILPLPLYCDCTCHCDLVRVRVRVLLRSTVSIDLSRYYDLACVLLLLPPSTLSIDPPLNCVVSYRIYSLLFTCRSDLVCVRVRVRVHVLLCSTVSIDPSLNRVVPDLFVSLNVPFRSYFSACASCSSSSYYVIYERS